MNRATKALLGTVMLGLSLLGLPPASSVRAGGLYMPCTQAEDFKFTVTIVNASDNSLTPLSFAPGVWALHARRNPLLQPGLEGRKELAQEGDPAVLAHALASTGVHSRIFYADRDHDETGFLLPGDSYAFTVQASTHTPYLSFALFMSANDWFISPDTQGIALVNAAGGPRADGDITDRLRLWHASTDAQEVTDDDAPAVSDLVRVILARARPTVFDVSIKNVSGSLAMSFAPGIFAAHTDPAAFYAEGHPRLFAEGRPHLGNGLEALAEDGDPGPIWMFIATAGYMVEPRQTTKFGIFDTPVDRREPGSLLPGSTYAFTVITDQSAPHLSLALMLRPSNDWFVATPARGVSLFQADGTPIAGAIPVHLYDAGTEEDEPFAAGAHQLPRQSAPNSGLADDETTVRRVEGMAAQDWIEVTVTPRVTQRFAYVLQQIHARIERGIGILKHHLHMAAQAFDVGVRQRGYVHPRAVGHLKPDGAARGVVRPHDDAARGRLAAAAFADEAQGFAGANIEADPVHGLDVTDRFGEHAPFDGKVFFERRDFQQGSRRGLPGVRGASRVQTGFFSSAANGDSAYKAKRRPHDSAISRRIGVPALRKRRGTSPRTTPLRR